MREKYTKASPSIIDILPTKVKHSKSSWDYILERTFMRPRDVIDFFNKCIKNADGKTKISMSIIKEAEKEYSHERLRALNDEWLENYGELYASYSFMKKIKNGFKIEDIVEKAEKHFIELHTEDLVNSLKGDLKKILLDYESNSDIKKSLRRSLVLFHEVGLIGIKISPDEKIKYSYNSYELIEDTDLEEDSRFFVHPMFVSALKILN
jgi:hypothetical protein